MGNSKSTPKTSDPFPVSAETFTNLSRLTYGTARILNTEDIYDLFNINKPGACGTYVVFKKKNVGLKLIPFIADISGTRQEYLYQDSLKSVSNLEERKQVCGELADTMLRTVAIIVACLASIQIYAPAVKARFDEVPLPQALARQRGGSQNDSSQHGGSADVVKDWLLRHDFIELATDRAALYKLKGTSYTSMIIMSFTAHSEQVSAAATLSVLNSSSTVRVLFLDPVTADEQGERAIPICISDNARPLSCGILYKKQYMPFDLRKKASNFGQFCSSLLTSQVYTESSESYEMFITLQELSIAGDQTAIQDALTQYFSQGGFGARSVLGARSGLGGRSVGLDRLGGLGLAARSSRLGLGGLGGIGGIGGLGGIGSNRLGLGAYRPRLSLDPRLGGVGGRGLLNFLQSEGGHIKGPAQKIILDYFANCRKMVPAEESPAARRVRTVVLGEEDRNARTNICADPYWKKANLGDIYPWATLQFLSVRDWNSIGTADVKFVNEWDDFMTQLINGYKGDDVPTIVSVAGRSSKRLEDWRFSGITSISICRPGREIKAFDIGAIKDLLIEMNTLYTRHVTAMTAIINSLIIEIDDEGTKVYRLNPKIFKSGKTTAKYINDTADEARTALCAFYLQVEKIYRDIVIRLSG